MKYYDVVFDGTGTQTFGPPGGPGFPYKGYRVAPILAAGAGLADVVAAFAGLVLRMERGSQARSLSQVVPPSTSDTVSIIGPDWHRSPGHGPVALLGGSVGVTYRMWLAEDCYEIVDSQTVPYLSGFAAGGSSPAAVARATYTAAQSSLANIPSLSTDGLAMGGANGVRALVDAGAGKTVTAGTLVWWVYDATLGRWAEGPVQETPPVGRRDVAGADLELLSRPSTSRVYAEWRSGTLSGAGSATLTLIGT